MRPFTAENTFISFPATVRWKNRSKSPLFLTDFAEKQVRTLMQTSNVSVFIDNSPMKLEASDLNSVKKTDKKEIHDQLTNIKTRFNKTRKRYSVGDIHLQYLEKISNEKAIENRIGNFKICNLTSKVEELNNSIKSVKSKQEETEDDMQIYWHVYERTKKSQVFLEIRANTLKSEIRKTNFIFESERRLQLKSRKSRTCSVQTYRNLYNFVASDTKEKQIAVEKVSKNIEFRELLLSKREERKKRFLDISEIAANEDRDKRATLLREGLILYKCWAKFLSVKLAYEMQKCSSIELAFQKIRAVTGEYNVHELVHKFLTREQTFKELKQSIDVSRDSIEDINKKNQDIEIIINSMSVFDKESRSGDIYNLKEKYAACLKDTESERQKLKILTLMREHIFQWSRRMLKIFDIQGEENQQIRANFKILARVIIEKIRSL